MGSFLFPHSRSSMSMRPETTPTYRCTNELLRALMPFPSRPRWVSGCGQRVWSQALSLQLLKTLGSEAGGVANDLEHSGVSASHVTKYISDLRNLAKTYNKVCSYKTN